MTSRLQLSVWEPGRIPAEALAWAEAHVQMRAKRDQGRSGGHVGTGDGCGAGLVSSSHPSSRSVAAPVTWGLLPGSPGDPGVIKKTVRATDLLLRPPALPGWEVRRRFL